MASFAVKFLGCKVSQADAMLARNTLLQAGHEEVEEERAELAVINTCCITREAEAKSRQSVRRTLRAAERVYVTGCAANLDSRQFEAIDPERVRALVGTADEVAAMLAGEAGACVDLSHRTGLGPRHEHEREARTRGFVKIQDGCDCRCAYCIIPAVRGAARSRSASAVLAEVRGRVARGQPEIVVTGISVGDYRDPEHGLELGQLMVQIAGIPGVERVRLSSVEVIHVKDSLVQALASEPKVCPHLHIPLQSGDDAVLRAMGRHYDSAEFAEHVRELRRVVPEVNLTTDVIVGFPTEDEAAFERTLALLDEAQISRVHGFSYSPRPGTVAAALGDRVTPEDKKLRSQRLRGRSEARSRLHRHAKLGSRQRVLIDKAAEKRCSGYTEDYTRCYLPAGAAVRGQLLDVLCEELEADGIRCSPSYP